MSRALLLALAGALFLIPGAVVSSIPGGTAAFAQDLGPSEPGDLDDPGIEEPLSIDTPKYPPGAQSPVVPPPTGFREKAYYVPFDKLDEVFEKTGRGIFLPYEEFLELWNAAEGSKPPEAEPKPPTAAVIRGGTYTGTVENDLARFTVRFGVESLQKGWSEVELPLRDVAIEEATLSDPAALFVAKGNGYSLYLPKPGNYDLELKLAVPVRQEPGRKSIAFQIPPTAVSRLDLTLPEADLRVDVQPVLAATQTIPGDGTTQLLAFLGNATTVSVQWSPPIGRTGDEGALLSARQQIRTYLGERILRVNSVIDLEILRGEVDTFRLRMPENTQLLSIQGSNMRAWNPTDDGFLDISLHAAVKGTYRLTLAFERILESTPAALDLPFPRVEGVLREAGWFVLGHDQGLIVRTTTVRGLSQVDPGEVPEELRASLGLGFRYLAHPLNLAVAVEKIVPEVRAASTSVVMLGREEDQWLGWIDYTITKSGLFRLAFRVPTGWEIDQVGDPSVTEEFQTSDEGGKTTVAVTTKSRVSGDFRLPFRLVREGTARPGMLTVSPPEVLEVLQDRGLLGVSAPRALDVVTTERTNLLDADVDELFRSGIMGQVSTETGIPRTYRYRKQPASVQLRLEDRKTEIDVLAQHLIEVADGEMRITHFLDYNVLYAPVDEVRFRAPSALDDVLQVEAKHKTQVRKTPAANGQTTWIVSLQPPLLGAVTLTVSHAVDLQGLESAQPLARDVPLLHAEGVRGEQGFVAVRKEGTLEIVPTIDEMEAIDATDLPDKLRRGQIYSAFRYFASDPKLQLGLTRYDYEQLATTVVQLMHLKCVLSEERTIKAQTTLLLQNTERQYLEVELAPEARILSLSVAGQPQTPKKRKEGAGTLIQIPRSAGSAFPVILVHEEPVASSGMGSFGSTGIRALRVLDGVPVSKIELELFLPPEYAYMGWDGTLHRRSESDGVLWPRFKRLLGIGGPPRAVARSDHRSALPSGLTAGLQLELPTRGYQQHYFDTLAPRGTLHFFYMRWGFFWFLDFLALLFGVAGTTSLFLRWPAHRLLIGAAAVFLTQSLAWFATGPTGTLFFTLFLGVLLVCTIFAAVAGGRRLRELRPERVKVAPDPFLEDGPDPRSAPSAGSSPADKEAGQGTTETAPADASGSSDSASSDSASSGNGSSGSNDAATDSQGTDPDVTDPDSPDSNREDRS